MLDDVDEVGCVGLDEGGVALGQVHDASEGHGFFFFVAWVMGLVPLKGMDWMRLLTNIS